MRILLAGCSGSEKTTCAEYLGEKYNLKVLPSAARAAFAKTGASSYAKLMGDPLEYGNFQRAVMMEQIRMENHAGSDYVSDRSVDQFAFCAIYGSGFQAWNEPAGQGYLKRLKARTIAGEALVVRVAPTREVLEAALAQGSRTEYLQWDRMNQFDGAVQFILKACDIPHKVLHVADLPVRKACLDLWIRELRGEP